MIYFRIILMINKVICHDKTETTLFQFVISNSKHFANHFKINPLRLIKNNLYTRLFYINMPIRYKVLSELIFFYLI
jgi:hypothetical protein